MRRRLFLKAALGTLLSAGSSSSLLAQMASIEKSTSTETYDPFIKDYLHKMRDFDHSHAADIRVDASGHRLLKKAVRRLARLQRTVGHGNFHLLDLDTALRFARNYAEIGPFAKSELDFLEAIFYQDASRYGFLGEKPLRRLTDRIRDRDVVKIPGTGNYLYKGRPVETYERIKRDVGDSAILTSGVRGVIKQFQLFLNKAYANDGNLSLASRSLAPPGFSYHGVGDFDVGEVGFGPDNFTERFVSTGVFKRLQDLSYVNLRYTRDNMLGVRFEPWHIKLDWRA